MKKLLFLLLSLAFTLNLTACGSAGTKASTPAVSDRTEVQAAAPSDAKGTGKILVVYYSASGNTERVAKDIAKATGADLFAIVPADPYTKEDLNYRNEDSRVNKEHEDESLRNIVLTTTEVKDWDSYDTVFIGYPIWWHIAAWPVDGFVKANDFSGKTVIPFATSTSSGMEESGSLLAKMARSGNWQAGERFASNASSTEVEKWVKSLGF